MNETVNNNLKIIKARVEQDKYAAVELKIIKANGREVLKDLYVEKEMNQGEIFTASDNVLVSLHRSLRSGEVANLQLISSTGEVLMRPEFSEINQFDNGLFVGVKAVSNMISIKNNQALKTDALKVQEIATDSKSIKEQMIHTMKSNHPDRELRFIYEDAYNEAAVYKIEKIDGKYSSKLVGDKASFIATDGINVYSHSNIVADITKIEKVGEEEVVVKNIEKVEMPTLNFGKIDHSVSMFEQYAPKSIPTPPEQIQEIKPIISEVNVDQVVIPVADHKPIQEEKIESAPKNNFFEDVDTSVLVNEPIAISDEKVLIEEDIPKKKPQTFDEFFGVSESVAEEKSMPVVEFEDYDSTDKYEQLGDMISKIITEQKEARDRLSEYETQVRDMEERLSKANQEIENKTKKVNTLINQNRQIGDENRSLKNRVNGLEGKVEKLEQSNEQYLKENDRLKTEANKGNAKLNGIISSVSELLGSYGESDHSYAVKKKVA